MKLYRKLLAYGTSYRLLSTEFMGVLEAGESRGLKAVDIVPVGENRFLILLNRFTKSVCGYLVEQGEEPGLLRLLAAQEVEVSNPNDPGKEDGTRIRHVTTALLNDFHFLFRDQFNPEAGKYCWIAVTDNGYLIRVEVQADLQSPKVVISTRLAYAESTGGMNTRAIVITKDGIWTMGGDEKGQFVGHTRPSDGNLREKIILNVIRPEPREHFQKYGEPHLADILFLRPQDNHVYGFARNKKGYWTPICFQREGNSIKLIASFPSAEIGVGKILTATPSLVDPRYLLLTMQMESSKNVYANHVALFDLERMEIVEGSIIDLEHDKRTVGFGTPHAFQMPQYVKSTTTGFFLASPNGALLLSGTLPLDVVGGFPFSVHGPEIGMGSVAIAVGAEDGGSHIIGISDAYDYQEGPRQLELHRIP